jgi:hypothetical protein
MQRKPKQQRTPKLVQNRAGLSNYSILVDGRIVGRTWKAYGYWYSAPNGDRAGNRTPYRLRRIAVNAVMLHLYGGLR